MAEEQFTSRRARREAERLAAEQAFEAQATPEQPSEPSSTEPADSPRPQTDATETSEPRSETPAAGTDVDEPAPADSEPDLDPQRAPLPHFDTRTGRKHYLRENGLSLEGDLSTGATPVVAGPQETSVPDSDEESSSEHESFDAAGFGGSADEVAARDFESPVTTGSAPRPTPLDEEPRDALSRPLDEEPRDALSRPLDGGISPASDPGPEGRGPGAETAEPNDGSRTGDGESEASRSRRMPIVQPPGTSGVRVVTAASAQIPEVDDSEPATATGSRSTAADGRSTEDRSGPGTVPEPRAETPAPADSLGTEARAEPAAGSPATESETDTGAAAPSGSSDDAARALAANPETRPMEAVPEAWALPNPDYEDEETENPPGTRVRASAVTGQDGRILVGEEPSKVPYVVLGVAALFAVALIVIALVMLL
ncbi:hypothetical protein [Brevibacterium marinum]|uniref:Uncharacterized protein n=1 Tax=Brevibacterium marinum TaxID=418643 RepID=A0A846RU57_9MICO|nr:hypothetical protein [Brevibacterium marinum]NJC57664.1 hypothetical protein [Brevibacterium marinum]